jgi:hypothetical protein
MNPFNLFKTKDVLVFRKEAEVSWKEGDFQ